MGTQAVLGVLERCSSGTRGPLGVLYGYSSGTKGTLGVLKANSGEYYAILPVVERQWRGTQRVHGGVFAGYWRGIVGVFAIQAGC
jgi:hypothetical protein